MLGIDDEQNEEKNTNFFFSYTTWMHVYYEEQRKKNAVVQRKTVKVCIKRNLTAELLVTLCLRQENLIPSK